MVEQKKSPEIIPTPDWNLDEILKWFFDKSKQVKDCKKDLTIVRLNREKILCLFYKVAEDYFKVIAERTEKQESYENELGGGRKLAKSLEEQLQTQSTELTEYENKLKILKNSLEECEKSTKNKDTELISLQQANLLLEENLKEPNSLWKWLVNRFPNFLKDGEKRILELNKQLEIELEKYRKLEIKYNTLDHDYNTVYHLMQQEKQERNKEKQEFSLKSRELENEISKLQKKNEDQFGEIAKLKSRPSETLEDYDKPENYQAAGNYKAFCTQFSLSTTTDNICDYFIGQQSESMDNTKYAFFNATIKKILSEIILVKAYEIQLRELLLKKPSQSEFDHFFELYQEDLSLQLKDLLNLDLQKELREEIKETAKQGFVLVKQLLSTNPSCHLYFPKEGSNFNPEECDVSEDCQKKGIIKFTVVPGVFSNHQLFMKPIVFTENQNKK